MIYKSTYHYIFTESQRICKSVCSSIWFLHTVQSSTFFFKNILYTMGILCINGVGVFSNIRHAFAKSLQKMITQLLLNCNIFQQFHALMDLIHHTICINVQRHSCVRMTHQILRRLYIHAGSNAFGTKRMP